MSLIHDEEAARAYLRGKDGIEPDEEMVQALLETVEDMDNWEISPHQSDMVRDMVRVGFQATPFFLGRRWSSVKFAEPGLVLTDKPITLYQKPERHYRWLGVGLATADWLWLPLDRSTALIVHNEDTVGGVVTRAPIGHGVDDFNQAVLGQAHQRCTATPTTCQGRAGSSSRTRTGQ
jgi:hypothetical protein